MTKRESVLRSALDRLGRKRPCFHSEADFQFALAWEIGLVEPSTGIRLEVNFSNSDKRYHIDLLLLIEGKWVGVEVKYKKADLDAVILGERFVARDSMAHDHGRYDFLKDVARCEQFIADGLVSEAYAILLTNHHLYWKDRSDKGQYDAAFHVGHGRTLSGVLSWAKGTGGAKRGREADLSFTGIYQMDWRTYAQIPNIRNGDFRYLLIPAVCGKPSLQLKDARSSATATFAGRPRKSEKYLKLANHLQTLNQEILKLQIDEIEKIVGDLPPSARRYREWWANHGANQQAKWLAAGYKIVDVNLDSSSIIFARIDTSKELP